MASSPDHDATVRALGAGSQIFGRYKLESIAGRGGMGVVWKARDEELERAVALKFLPEFVAADPEAARDLKRETKRSLELTHANIVRVFDFLTDGRDAAIAMEFVEGESLAARKARAPGGCLGIDELAPLARQLCTALAYAHVEGKIVHRDLKPANLLVTKDGKLKITDFGIARSLSESQTRLTGRAVAGTSGTLLYISPQQMGGDKPSAADDIYALGATLYELLTGKPPFYRGDAFSLMKQVAERAPAPLEEHRADAGCEGPPIPAAWSATILACLAKDPAARPASAEEVMRRLFATEETLPATTRLPVPPSPAPVAPAPAPVRPIPPPFESPPPPPPVAMIATGPLPPPPPPAPPSPPPEPPAPMGVTTTARRISPRTEPPPPEPVASEPPAAPPPPPDLPPPARIEPKRRSRVPLLVGGGLAVVIGVAIWFFGVHLPAVEEEAKQARAAMVQQQEEFERAQRLAKEQQEKSVAEAQQKARVLALLDSARAMDRPESAEQGLQLVAKILELEPRQPEALALQKKLAAHPRTLKVPGRYRKFGDALDNARAGDTIELEAGVHEVPGNVCYSINVPLTIRGAGVEATTIRQAKPAQGEPETVFWVRNSTGLVRLTGFTVEVMGASSAETRPIGILMDGCNAELLQVAVKQSSGNGAMARQKATVRATSCRFEQNGWIGFRVADAGTRVTLRDCSATSNGTGGFYFEQGAVEIANSTARGNGQGGFTALGGATGKWTGNVAVDNKQTAFRLAGAGTAIELTENEARGGPDNYPAFSAADGARGIFRRNRATEGPSLGFRIMGEGTSVTFDKDEARARTIGFRVQDGAIAECVGVVSRDCTSSGFVIAKTTRVTLNGAQALNNGGNGIFARESASVTATNLVVTGNKRTGVYWEDDSKIELRGNNRVEKNGTNGDENIRQVETSTSSRKKK